MNPFLKFLAAARSLKNQGFKKEQVYDFARQEFGEINELMQKQIENIFNPKKTIGSKNKYFDPNDPLPYYNETPGEFARRETPGSKENLLQELKIAYEKEFNRLRGDETAEELKEILKNLDTDGVPFASGGRAGYYGGGQAMVGEDLSEIGHGSDSLMARNMQLAPNSMATTSTGLNYLLGQDNDTARVPYNEGKKVKGPNPKVLELMLNEKMSYPDALKELKMREKQQPYIDQRYNMGPGPILEAAEGGPARVPYAGGGKGMNRRGFLGLLGGIGAGIAGLKSGILGFGGKKAATEVAKEVATSGGGVPPYFFKLVEKIKMLGDDVTQTQSLADRQVVKKYKDFELTEDVSTGRIEIQRYKQSDEATYYGQPLTEETYMSYSPGEQIFQETGKGKTKIIKTQPEYQEGTSFIRNDRGYTGEVVDESTTISDDVLQEVEAGSGNVPESFYTGPNPIKKADGGRIGYKLGKKVLPVVKEGIETLKNKVNEAFGKKVITTADQIPRSTDALKRDMFTEANKRLNKPTIPGNIDLPVQQEGKFTKAEYLIQRIKNTIKGNPNDKYVQDTFPGFIDELKANPDLAKNENVFKELGGDLPEGQQIVVYGDDSVDFFTQKSGPGNIDRLKKLMEKHNISREKALKIMKMEPNDQVMELKMLEVANRKLNSEGGRIGLLSGGGPLKALINNLAKERGFESGSELLKIMNYKNLPSKVKNLMTKEEFDTMKANRLEGVERWKDLMISQQEMTKNIDAGMNTPAAGLFKELEKTSPGYGIVPRNIRDKDILQMEQMIKNMETKGKGRKLNATGGIATMLGE